MKQTILLLFSYSALNLSCAVVAQQRVSPPRPGMISTSSDSGKTWSSSVSNRQWHAVASSADGLKLVAADYGPRDIRHGGTIESSGGRIYTSTNSGATWTPQYTNRFWMSIASSADGTRNGRYWGS